MERTQSVFNDNLEKLYHNKLPPSFIFELGFPSDILQECDFPKNVSIKFICKNC